MVDKDKTSFISYSVECIRFLIPYVTVFHDPL